MICDECGSSRVHWRCDNQETQTTKYKCLDCGTIMTKKTEKKLLFKQDELKKLEKEKEEHIQRKHKQGAKKRWKYKIPRNYNRTLCNTFMVTKWVDKKQQYFGTYKTEEDAQFVVNRLRECGWDKKELWNIRKELYDYKEQRK